MARKDEIKIQRKLEDLRYRASQFTIAMQGAVDAHYLAHYLYVGDSKRLQFAMNELDKAIDEWNVLINLSTAMKTAKLAMCDVQEGKPKHSANDQAAIDLGRDLKNLPLK